MLTAQFMNVKLHTFTLVINLECGLPLYRYIAMSDLLGGSHDQITI
jgi:hypothetical protein